MNTCCQWHSLLKSLIIIKIEKSNENVCKDFWNTAQTQTHKHISRIYNFFATCNKETSSVSFTNKWIHRKQTHRSKEDIYQHDWPTSTDYQTNQHIWYVSGSEILAVWLRKRGGGAEVVTWKQGMANNEQTEGERLWRKERRRIQIRVHGLAFACWQETPLQLECLISTASKPECLGKSFLASRRDTFTHKHDLATDLKKLTQIFTPLH